jgi:hypothetical protein
MAGVSSATLEAWAIPVVGTAGPDHTYAVSSCGLLWRCHGRSAGGILLRSRTGSSAIANCLAQPNGEAGVRYARTGVCHQIANRILHPAGITVAGCGGYNLSIAVWGEYGKLPWPELQACYSSGGAGLPASPVAGGSAGQSWNFSGSSGVYDTPQSGRELTKLTEFLTVAEGALGRRLDEPTRRSLQKIQKDFSRRQTRLVHNLDIGIVAPEVYLDQLNAVIKTMMDRMRDALGEERFTAIFGEAGRHPESLVDRSTFMDAIASERAPPHGKI